MRGTYHTHPNYGGGASDPHDIAVVVLDQNQSATPARLPTLNQLGSMNLKSRRFTAVGYGDRRESKSGGNKALFFDGERRYVTQSFNALTKAWLKLDMNPSTGSGGTCYGDSGGPHFLGAGANETNLLVALTVTGDTPMSLDRRGLPRGHRVRPRLPARVRDIALAPLYPPRLDRARRGGSGALSPAIRSSRAEFPFEGLRPRGQYAGQRRRWPGPARRALANQVRSGRKQP